MPRFVLQRVAKVHCCSAVTDGPCSRPRRGKRPSLVPSPRRRVERRQWPPTRTPCSRHGSPRRGRAEPNDPEAMALATADADGRPSARMVLLKGHDERGFAFYTNVDSRKGEELAANPRAALALPLEVAAPPGPDRRAGRAGRAAPRRTPISPPARAMPSSAPGRRTSRARSTAAPPSRRATSKLVADHEGRDVPRPPHWWGYRVVPERIEFWTDRAHRLHERRLFTRERGRAGPKACSTHEPGPPSSPPSFPLVADHARGAGQRLHRALPARSSRPLPPGRPARWRCSARSPTPGSICSPRSSPCSASASPPCRPTASTASATARRKRWPPWPRSGSSPSRPLAIGWRAIERLVDGEQTAHADYGIAVSLVAIAVDPGPARLPALGDPRAPARSRSAPTTSIIRATCCSTCR